MISHLFESRKDGDTMANIQFLETQTTKRRIISDIGLYLS
jgi:hypothetical protein